MSSTFNVVAVQPTVGNANTASHLKGDAETNTVSSNGNSNIQFNNNIVVSQVIGTASYANNSLQTVTASYATNAGTSVNSVSSSFLKYNVIVPNGTASYAMFAANAGGTNISSSATTNGFTYLPGGMIMQWGYHAYPSNGTYSFPITFPSACLNFIASNSDSQGAGVDAAFGYFVNSGSFVIGTKNNYGNVTGYPIYWFAIGY